LPRTGARSGNGFDADLLMEGSRIYEVSPETAEQAVSKPSLLGHSFTQEAMMRFPLFGDAYTSFVTVVWAKE